MIQIVWDFVVRTDAVECFERAYGPDGAWASERGTRRGPALVHLDRRRNGKRLLRRLCLSGVLLRNRFETAPFQAVLCVRRIGPGADG